MRFRSSSRRWRRRSDLRPDVPVTKSGPMPLAGRPLDVHVTDKAVSDADVWLFDKDTRIAVIGDLVTRAGAVLRNGVSRTLARVTRRSLGDAIRDRRARTRPPDDPRPVRYLPAGVRRVCQLRAVEQRPGAMLERMGRRRQLARRRRSGAAAGDRLERRLLRRLSPVQRRQGARLHREMNARFTRSMSCGFRGA